MAEFLLMLFPVAFVTILVVGARRRKNEEAASGAWNLDQAKALQAVAALMIILHHLVQRITNYGAVNKGPVTLWNFFGILFTTIFFFFSGFGLYKNYRAREDYLDGFLKHRLPKVLVPFLLTNVIYLLLFAGDRIKSPGFILTSIFGFTLINHNAWFVVEIIILYIAFYVCFRWCRSERAAICCLTGFTLLLVMGSLLLGHDSGGKEDIRWWFMGEWWYNTTLIFIMGILFAKYERQIKAAMGKAWKVLLPVSVVLLAGWYILEQFIEGRFGYYQEWAGHPGYPEKLITLLVQLILCMLFMFVLLLINLKVRFGNPVLRFLGAISFEIYLIHDVYMRLLPGGVGKKLPDPAYLALTYGLSILTAWVIAKVDRSLLKRKE